MGKLQPWGSGARLWHLQRRLKHLSNNSFWCDTVPLEINCKIPNDMQPEMPMKAGFCQPNHCLRAYSKGKGRSRESSQETIVTIQGDRTGGVKTCSDSRYILKTELTPYVGKLDVECDRKQRNQEKLEALGPEKKEIK